jgi:hypothetical protein
MDFDLFKEKNINKPQKGHMKGLGSFAKLREFRCEVGEIKKGDKSSCKSSVASSDWIASDISEYCASLKQSTNCLRPPMCWP